ncbi:cytochrome P450 [Rhodovulum iodosum]|uniref:Cytochrome P450 n=1 Tax=Rhodovulum iodosum TaxID=68291 RepID=A0ABV3XXQ5_9RHOB|nr:hypothetical protein EJA01_02295 [Rhodovulum robiginosum]
MAVTEATLSLATLLSRFTSDLSPGFARTPQMWVTLRPATGIPLQVRSRAA